MPPVEQAEFQSFRSRVFSMENRLLSFERNVMGIVRDIGQHLGLSISQAPPPETMLKTPAEIVFLLRTQYPDLEGHPTLWRDFEQALLSQRHDLNQTLQQEAANAMLAWRKHLEGLLHPPDRDADASRLQRLD